MLTPTISQAASINSSLVIMAVFLSCHRVEHDDLLVHLSCAARGGVGGSAFRSHGSVQGWQSRLPQLRTWNTAETASRSLAQFPVALSNWKVSLCYQAT